MKTIIALLSLSILISCDFQGDPNEEIDEGVIENNSYHSNDIGWTMEIPKGWSITTMEETDEDTELGSELFEEELGMEVDYSNLNNLLAFQKDQFNNFSSTSEKWEDDGITIWSENNALLKAYLMQIFEGQGINVDSSFTKTVEIDGIEFENFSFTANTPDGSPLFKQSMFSCLIKGYDFGVSIMYNNEKDKNEMMEAWMNSKFE